MRFMKLSSETLERINDLYLNGSSHRIRSRAHAILLSSRGYSRQKIGDLLQVLPDTISTWFNQIETDANWNLMDLPGRGRKSNIKELTSKKI